MAAARSPSGRFQKGFDPRRHVLTTAERRRGFDTAVRRRGKDFKRWLCARVGDTARPENREQFRRQQQAAAEQAMCIF